MKIILVADDNEWEVEKLVKELKEKYTVEYVSDGKQAIERIGKGGLDGAVLDWQMPPIGMNEREARRFYGNNVARRARDLQPNLALVLRSSAAEEFIKELKPYDVLCHQKQDGNQPILNYFQQKLGE